MPLYSFFVLGWLFVVLLAGLLHGLPKLGVGVAEAIRKAPTLDVIVSLFTWIPPVVAACLSGERSGWCAAAICFVGQGVGLQTWVWGHELIHRKHAKGPRIIKFLNQRVGRVRNHLGLWVTVIALPAFLLVRLAELVVWPPLAWLMRFPQYKQSEWVNCSRHKFDGLVGHDRIWCLYCDWMTGVYSFGAECLRNVETFWCPIQFGDQQKCENCQIDFPDVREKWVKSNQKMADVVAAMEEHYPDSRPTNDWWCHPARLTVEGKSPSAPDQ